MQLTEKEFIIKTPKFTENLFNEIEKQCKSFLPSAHTPVRFTVSDNSNNQWKCEVGSLDNSDGKQAESIFSFTPRPFPSDDKFNAVLLIPTGIGAEIGGHAGDAGAVARLMAASCDTLITHPNVVNASDINELPDNGLYVEGSILSRLMMGSCGLRRVRSNRIMVVMDDFQNESLTYPTINAVSAAVSTTGINCVKTVKMANPHSMKSSYTTAGRAVGEIENLNRLFDVLEKFKGEYDAVALASAVKLPENLHEQYLKSEGSMVNPWGGAEAMLTHAVSMYYNLPSAHAPMLDSLQSHYSITDITDPRMAAEEISSAFIHCVLKGLQRSPQLVTDSELMKRPEVITAEDISCLIIPDNCIGLPVLAALLQNIPVIVVKGNSNCMRNDLDQLPFAKSQIHYVNNYLEAAGLMNAMKAGLCKNSLIRPLEVPEVEVI